VPAAAPQTAEAVGHSSRDPLQLQVTTTGLTGTRLLGCLLQLAGHKSLRVLLQVRFMLELGRGFEMGAQQGVGPQFQQQQVLLVVRGLQLWQLGVEDPEHQV